MIKEKLWNLILQDKLKRRMSRNYITIINNKDRNFSPVEDPLEFADRHIIYKNIEIRLEKNHKLN